MNDHCPSCHQPFDFSDSGDGPAVFVILAAGFLVVALALYVEVVYQPAYWVHAVLWLPLTLASTLGLLRPLKAWFMGQQFRNKAAQHKAVHHAEDLTGDAD